MMHRSMTRENARRAAVLEHNAKGGVIRRLTAALDLLPRPRLDPAATPPTGLVFRKPERLIVSWD